MKPSDNSTNLTAHMVKRHKGMKVEPPMRSCRRQKQTSLGDVGIRVVLPKMLFPESYNIVNR